jgi:hypothetical protein
MTAHYDELLALCAFDPKEIADQRPRIESAFDRLDLGPADMDRAVSRVRQSFDMELTGVRKALGVWLKELFDVVLAREEGKKLIYFGYPPFQYIGLVIKAATGSDDFYIGCPEVVLCQTLGQIFNKLNPVLEEGEAKGLAPGHAMCSLLQIKNGALEKGYLPVPDMSIATSYFCDMGPKADELMQYKYGYPVQYVDSCLDSRWGQWPAYDPEKVHYLGTQVNDLFKSLKDLFDLEITEEIWNNAKYLAARLYLATNQLNQYMTADPVPLGVADSELIINFPMGCTGVAMEEGAEAVEILAREVGERVEKGIGVFPKGSPRVALAFQSLVDPVFNRMIGEVGLAVPVVAVLLPPPPVQNSDDYPTFSLGEKRAEKAMHGGAYHSSYGLIKRMEESLKFAQVDGMIYNYQFSCRPLACNSKLLKLHVEKERGLPTLLLDMDFYDDRNYSAAALRTRLEAFAEMLKARKATA